MSSRILRKGDTTEVAAPIAWTVVHTAAEAPSVQLPPLTGETRPKPAGAAGGPASEALAELSQPQAPDEAHLKRIKQLETALADLKAQMERGVREAREEGRRQGEAAGRQAARAEIEPVLDRLTASARDLADLRPKLRMQAEADLVRLAVAIARRILHRELNTDEEAVAGLVRVAFEKLRVQEVTRVRVHPDLKAAVASLLARGNGLAQVDVMADPSMQRGGLIFETTRGNLDVSAETLLREMERGLTDRFRGQE